MAEAVGNASVSPVTEVVRIDQQVNDDKTLLPMDYDRRSDSSSVCGVEALGAVSFPVDSHSGPRVSHLTRKRAIATVCMQNKSIPQNDSATAGHDPANTGSRYVTSRKRQRPHCLPSTDNLVRTATGTYRNWSPSRCYWPSDSGKTGSETRTLPFTAITQPRLL